jgi:hypothetical protein
VLGHVCPSFLPPPFSRWTNKRQKNGGRGGRKTLFQVKVQRSLSHCCTALGDQGLKFLNASFKVFFAFYGTTLKWKFVNSVKKPARGFCLVDIQLNRLPWEESRSVWRAVVLFFISSPTFIHSGYWTSSSLSTRWTRWESAPPPASPGSCLRADVPEIRAYLTTSSTAAAAVAAAIFLHRQRAKVDRILLRDVVGAEDTYRPKWWRTALT